MDMTIGTALWFASRGRGNLYQPREQNRTDLKSPYTSYAKILIDGLGADELLAGYSRHRTAFKKGGWKALQAELDLDFNRLWERNLGRDDRLISHHAREVRFPFLDENVCTFLHQIPLFQICDLRLQPGVGDKRLLRQVWYLH